jgi:hypothetical protein
MMRVLVNLPGVHVCTPSLLWGFRKELLYGLCVIHVKSQVCIGGQVVHQQLNKLRDVSILGIILHECGELGRVIA